MKKLIIHWGFVILGLVLSGMILITEIAIYEKQSIEPVVCSFVGWDQVKNNNLKMKLKCGDKEYYSTDAKLILWHINNPAKQISGMVDKNGNVAEGE